MERVRGEWAERKRDSDRAKHEIIEHGIEGQGMRRVRERVGYYPMGRVRGSPPKSQPQE